MKPRLPTPKMLALAAAAALLLALLAVPSALGGPSGARARVASSYMTGIGNENADMLVDPLWQRLHTKIVRYIAPYDAAVHPYYRDLAENFIQHAEAAHQQVLVAFYHSEYTPTVLPSVATYKSDVQKFVRLFPNVKQYQAWDEANRGNEAHQFSSPSAVGDAKYYQALLRVCSGCTVVGLDVLDQYYIGSTLVYIAEFKREIYRLETIMPKIWGLHDYSDVNRLESWRTRDLVRALGGQVWLTETGGIVKFGGSFPNVRGSGLRRAAKVIKFTFALAASIPQVKRLYLYDWSGGTQSTRFDAGLTNAQNRPREGYLVICRALHAADCSSVRLAGT
jgi:hypothetical protein